MFGDRIWLAEDVSPPEGSFFADGPTRLLRMQMDGSAPEDLLGRDVDELMQIDGDLWLAIPTIDDRSVGELEAVDLASGEHEPLLDSVHGMIASGPSLFVDDSPNDALVQRVDAESTGVWLVDAERLR